MGREAMAMSQTFTLPTNSNRDTGVVLLFLSLVFYYAIPYLAYEFGFSYGTTALISTPVGLLLMVLGLAMLFLARKIITVEPGLVRIKDGFTHKPLTLRYTKTPIIKLAVYEENHHGRIDEVWTVHLDDDGRQYLIDRRVGQHIACRSLAEKLAKATQGSLEEMWDGKSYNFGLAELDLSFVERIEKHPSLMGQAVEEPSDKVVHYQRDASGIEVNWSFFRSSLLFEVVIITAFLMGAAFIPLPGGPEGRGFTLFEAERSTGDYRYLSGVAVFTVISLALLAGYRNSISLNADVGLVSRSTVWGIPVRTGKIPLHLLEHIGVDINSRGPYIQMISDKLILKEMLPSTHIARWLAWEMRQYLASVGTAALKKPA